MQILSMCPFISMSLSSYKQCYTVFLFKNKLEWDKKPLSCWKIFLRPNEFDISLLSKIYHKMPGTPGQNITGMLKVNSGGPQIS